MYIDNNDYYYVILFLISNLQTYNLSVICSFTCCTKKEMVTKAK